MPGQPFHVMVKPTGAVSNLDCEYCFFLSKEQRYPGSSFRMSEDVQETDVTLLLASHGPQDEVTLAHQDGEPTFDRVIAGWERVTDEMLPMADASWGGARQGAAVVPAVGVEGDASECQRKPRQRCEVDALPRGPQPEPDRRTRTHDRTLRRPKEG